LIEQIKLKQQIESIAMLSKIWRFNLWVVSGQLCVPHI